MWINNLYLELYLEGHLVKKVDYVPSNHKRKEKTMQNYATHFCFVNVKAKLLNLATKLVSFFWCTNRVCSVNERHCCSTRWTNKIFEFEREKITFLRFFMIICLIVDYFGENGKKTKHTNTTETLWKKNTHLTLKLIGITGTLIFVH